MIRERRWPYDLMVALVQGRCPRCRSYLVTAYGRDGASCGALLCHLGETWPQVQVDDAWRAFCRRKGLSLERMRSMA